MLGTEGLLAADFQIRDGKLYCFRKESVEMIRPWGAEAGAWRLRAGTGWQAFTPELRIARLEEVVSRYDRIPHPPARQGRRLEAYRFLLGSWPAEAKGCVRPFAGSHWVLLQLVNRGGQRAVQLLRSNPALGFLVATGESIAHREVQALLGARRRRIAARFGFPETELAVRLLGKIPADWVSPELLRALRELLIRDAPTCYGLAHLPRINLAALGVLGRPELRGLVSFECLRQICQLGPEVPHLDLVARIDALLDTAQREGWRPARIRRLRDIDQLHLRLAPQRPRPPTTMPRRPEAVPKTVPAPRGSEGNRIQAIRTPGGSPGGGLPNGTLRGALRALSGAGHPVLLPHARARARHDLPAEARRGVAARPSARSQAQVCPCLHAVPDHGVPVRRAP
jgi:hypothetical protein